MTDASASSFRITGRHVAAGLTLFFAIIIVLDVLFATLAYRTFSGQAATNPYTAGLLFNRTLAQRQAEAALGWQVSFRQTGSQAELVFTDRDDRPLDNLAITAVLERPATEAGRRPMAFQARGGGIYAASIAGLGGAWDITATAKNATGDRFEVEHRMVLP
jgi:nitrogen fixation protein FixH